ncbi:hypothetical protein ACETAC_01060 [Aceticella autotrophica]|uniref:Uncharacterized protein n=1 Tax=Aceticella autotrophica TaxID=2755338 RepID=A0A975AW38_9THEO|nr:hypothetical protein [Aceticella autotrophica]QSZ27544.1 hypothetical protein ACETAC_01060 [Aceticella autotrophica]
MRYFKPLASILVAIIIYVVFRSKNLILYKWIGVSTNSILILFSRNIQNNNYFLNWIIYSLPDGLWLYSLTTIMILIWRNEASKIKYLFIYVGFTIAISHELGQFLHIFRGTFDVGDIVAYIMAILFALITIKFNGGEKHEQKI